MYRPFENSFRLMAYNRSVGHRQVRTHTRQVHAHTFWYNNTEENYVIFVTSKKVQNCL